MFALLIASYAAAGVLSIALLDYGKKSRSLSRSPRQAKQSTTPWYPTPLAVSR